VRTFSRGALWLVLGVSLGVPTTGAVGQDKIKVEGYAEFRKQDAIIVDGQVVRAAPGTVFKGKGINGLQSIPLGFEVKVEGRRGADGVILARQVEAKPNGQALFEAEVLNASAQAEQIWVENGMMFEPLQDGRVAKIGEIRESGPHVRRARNIMGRLRPSYVDEDGIRLRVVETGEWNASAMGNGAIWVYTGLMDSTSDDELAIVLGHELAHYTHEHSRRNARKAMIAQLIGAGAMIGASTIDDSTARTAAMLGSVLGLSAFRSGYSRDLEDQADRVGLRYVHEAGYDVRRGPALWGKFRDKYGESDRVQNFFFGSHSRPSDRIRNIERELALNYGARPR
jgi:Zn-dependent protease with chaperone function